MVANSDTIFFISVTVLISIFVSLQIFLDISDIRKHRLGKNHSSGKSKSNLALDKSITSALIVHELVLLGLVAEIKSRPSYYKRKHKVTLSDILNDLSARIEQWLQSWLNAAVLIGVVLMMTGLVWLLRPTDRAVLIMYLVAFYVFTVFLAQTRLKRFILIDNINLLLIAPLGLLMNLAVVVYTFALVLIKAVRRLIKRLSLSGNGANYNH